jgi:hypothetical protein
MMASSLSLTAGPAGGRPVAMATLAAARFVTKGSTFTKIALSSRRPSRLAAEQISSAKAGAPGETPAPDANTRLGFPESRLS